MKKPFDLIIVTAIVAVIFLGSKQSLAGDTLTSVTNFDDFLKVFNYITKHTEKIRFTEAVWGEIRADYPDDLNKATLLYNQFSSAIGTMEHPEQVQAAAELLQEIRRHLISKNAHLLANTWNGNQFPNTDAIRKFCQGLLKDYELDTVKDIYNRAIDEIYPLRSTETLASFLYDLVDSDQPNTFEVMVSAQLYLYWRFVSTDGVNDDYLFNLGIYFHQIIRSDKYSRMTIQDQRRVRKAIDSLPSSLHNFLFESNFCLANKNRSQVMFSHESYNLSVDKRFVFVYAQENTVPANSQVGWTLGVYPENLVVSSGSIDVRFSFKSNDTSLYMYLEQNVVAHRDIIALYRRTNVEPENSEWQVQFLENQLVFHQNGFLMCVSDARYDSSRIYVNGFNDYYNTPDYAPCQWEAIRC